MPTNTQITSLEELYRLLGLDTYQQHCKQDVPIPTMLSAIQDDINKYSPVYTQLQIGKTGMGSEYIRVTTHIPIEHANILFPIESLSHWFLCIKSFIQVNC